MSGNDHIQAHGSIPVRGGQPDPADSEAMCPYHPGTRYPCRILTLGIVASGRRELSTGFNDLAAFTPQKDANKPGQEVSYMPKDLLTLLVSGGCRSTNDRHKLS